MFTKGLWYQRREIERISGYSVVFCKGHNDITSDFVAIAGWGYKESADFARKVSKDTLCPYWALEDGFIRAITPGVAEPSSSMIIDRQGIYYDARSQSELQTLFDECIELEGAKIKIAAEARCLLRKLEISKYNNFIPGRLPSSLKGFCDSKSILLIDQTMGDFSIRGAIASSKEFEKMVSSALMRDDVDNIIIKTHPDVVAGLKKGMLKHPIDDPRVTCLSENVSPWILLECVCEVHTVSSQLGFEALVAGKEVHCWGMPFYAGRGLTVDHSNNTVKRCKNACVEQLVYAIYFRYCSYFDHWSRMPIDFFKAVEQLAYLRSMYNKKPFKIPSFLPRELKTLYYGKILKPERS